jgi:hypothetical protein
MNLISICYCHFQIHNFWNIFKWYTFIYVFILVINVIGKIKKSTTHRSEYPKQNNMLWSMLVKDIWGASQSLKYKSYVT